MMNGVCVWGAGRSADGTACGQVGGPELAVCPEATRPLANVGLHGMLSHAHFPPTQQLPEQQEGPVLLQCPCGA